MLIGPRGVGTTSMINKTVDKYSLKSFKFYERLNNKLKDDINDRKMNK